MMHRSVAFIALLLLSPTTWATPRDLPGTLTQLAPAKAHYSFEGIIGDRVRAHIDGWLLPAPVANPGMTEMFQMRDRIPVPQLVPWAGEFAGKYLIGAIQALRMSDAPHLQATVEEVIAAVLAGQAEDGYLGPFRKEERLLSHWDLWGHYHLLLALLMWHEDTGDMAALKAACRIGDLVCETYLNTTRRPRDAGSDEMNLSIIHGLGWLHRVTGEARYVEMMKVIETDWESTGDYFRQGLAGTPFYKIPRPRWESLHSIQGLIELFRITGDPAYAEAFRNLWESIARHDRHNTGGFSTGEQAIGNPYTPGAIETCCTVAWSALCVDMLHLTGDARAADELELSLFNSTLGSMHPSGRWYTYDTPMDGKREASAHTIVFQSRAGTPELNCCSVNAPRGIGMLSEWGVTLVPGEDALSPIVSLNHLGAMDVSLGTDSGKKLRLAVDTRYPAAREISISIMGEPGAAAALQVRIPGWSKTNQVTTAMKELAAPAGYRRFALPAHGSGELTLSLDFSLRTWLGDGAAAGTTSLYVGPLLLAVDQKDNAFDLPDLRPLDFQQLAVEAVEAPPGRFAPMVAFMARSADGQKIRLRDFATAGASGTQYSSWLPVINAPPPVFSLLEPKSRVETPPPPMRFSWTALEGDPGRHFRLEIARDADFAEMLHSEEGIRRSWAIVRSPLPADVPLYWRVHAVNAVAQTAADDTPRVFTVNSTLQSDFNDNMALYEPRADGVLIEDRLDGAPAPSYGFVEHLEGVAPASDRHEAAGGALAFEGHGLVRYRTPGFSNGDYSVALWFNPKAHRPGIVQLFSAWCKGGDDPLRITLEGGKVHARIEGGAGARTTGAIAPVGNWTHVAAVKQGARLSLFVNGALVDAATAPAHLASACVDVAIGGNPYHSGDEYFVGTIDALLFTARPLNETEIKAQADAQAQ